MSNADASNSVRTVDGVIHLLVTFCFLCSGRFGGYVVTCNWWWPYVWEHRGSRYIGWCVYVLENAMLSIVGVSVGMLLHAIGGGHIRGNIL